MMKNHKTFALDIKIKFSNRFNPKSFLQLYQKDIWNLENSEYVW